MTMQGWTTGLSPETLAARRTAMLQKELGTSFKPWVLELYRSLRDDCGDSHSTALATIRGELLMAARK